MSNFNRVFLMGRLTRDPELRYTPQGLAVSDLGLAVNREFSVQGGEKRKDTVFVDVTVWRKHAELCCQYLKKGSPIFIEGRLALDTWEGQDGQKRSKLRVIADNFQFIGGSRTSGGDAPPADPQSGEAPPPTEYEGGFRRTVSSPPGRGVEGAAPAPLNTGGDSFEAAKDDDIPF